MSQRTATLFAIRSAGARGDQAAFVRLYTENRISYPVAIAEYRAGVAWEKRVSAMVAAREAGQ